MIPLSLENAVEDEIALTVIDHAMERTIGYEHYAAVADVERFGILLAHYHLAVSLHEEVYLLLPRMSMASGLPASPETSGTQYQIVEVAVVPDHVVVIVADHLAANVAVVEMDFHSSLLMVFDRWQPDNWPALESRRAHRPWGLHSPCSCAV